MCKRDVDRVEEVYGEMREGIGREIGD